MSAVTTHVLDAGSGGPATGMAVRLERLDGEVLARGTTDDDGRVPDLGPDRVEVGAYRLVFDTAGWSARTGTPAFFTPEVVLTFTVTDPVRHHHVPLLLSPFACTTYRGS